MSRCSLIYIYNTHTHTHTHTHTRTIQYMFPYQDKAFYVVREP